MTSTPRSQPWNHTLYPMLREDEQFSIDYLNEAMMDDEPHVFLIALRHVAEARGIGMSELARDTGLDRAGLYRTFSEKGNPAFLNLTSILQALGLQITIAKKAS